MLFIGGATSAFRGNMSLFTPPVSFVLPCIEYVDSRKQRVEFRVTSAPLEFSGLPRPARVVLRGGLRVQAARGAVQLHLERQIRNSKVRGERLRVVSFLPNTNVRGQRGEAVYSPR